MFYKLGDTVVLKNMDYFTEYNGKEFEIIEVWEGYCYRVKASGFDPVWVTARNFVEEEC